MQSNLIHWLNFYIQAARREQYEKLSVMLDDLKDSEVKLKALLNNMDKTESRIDDLLGDLEAHQVRFVLLPFSFTSE